jgi:hypothetical protein
LRCALVLPALPFNAVKMARQWLALRLGARAWRARQLARIHQLNWLTPCEGGRVAREPRISEAASKNRRKRGRPRVLPPEYERALQHLFPDVQSRRHLQDVACRQRALALFE